MANMDGPEMLIKTSTIHGLAEINNIYIYIYIYIIQVVSFKKTYVSWNLSRKKIMFTNDLI
jgi:hypothetical protein